MACATSAIFLLAFSSALYWDGEKLQLPTALAQSINPNAPPPPELPEPLPLPSESPLQTPPPAPIPQRPNFGGSFFVKEFEFEGNTVIDGETLRAELEDLTGTELTFAELLQVADRIAQLYIQQGYITSGAYIPEQNTGSGVIRVQILEGSLKREDIEVTVKGGRIENYVKSRLVAATGGVFNFNRLQSALILLQQDPLIESLSAELTAGIEPGTNGLKVEVNGAKTFNAFANLDNNRNPSVGSFQRGGGISFANLLGLGDSLSVGYSNTDGSNEIQGAYTIPVNPRNGTLNLSFRYLDSEIIEAPFDELDIESSSRYYDLTYRQPVILRAGPEAIQELALGLNLSRRESDSTLGNEPFPTSLGADDRGKTRVSALRFFQEWRESKRQQVLVARSQFSAGVGAFDATINEEEPDSRFFAWRGQVLWLRQLGERTGEPAIGPTLLARLDIQLADELLPLEQFGLGGQATVRGYRQDVLLTDNGVLASVEARLPILRVPAVDGNLQIIPFIDFGTGWNANGENPDPNTVVGTGVGLRWEMGKDFTARLDYGIPLVEVDSRERTWQENGLYFSVNYNVEF